MSFWTQWGAANAATEQGLRPSFFEVTAQASLSELFHPAWRHAISVLALYFPRVGYPALRWQNEIYLTWMALVEWQHIRVWNSSFSEHFYGLTRKSATNGKGNVFVSAQLLKPQANNALTRQQQWLSLLVILLVPYVEAKLKEKYEIMREQRQPNRKTQWMLRFLLASHSLTLFLYQFLYLYNKTPYASPWLHLLGLKLVRLTHADAEKMALNNATTKPWQYVAHLLSERLLPLTVFAYRCVEWWYTVGQSARPMKDAAIPPPPPRLPVVTKKPLKAGECYLCQRPFTNLCAIPSGYCFCYPCIHQYIAEQGKCPITAFTCRIEDIRKIYVS